MSKLETEEGTSSFGKGGLFPGGVQRQNCAKKNSKLENVEE